MKHTGDGNLNDERFFIFAFHLNVSQELCSTQQSWSLRRTARSPTQCIVVIHGLCRVGLRLEGHKVAAPKYFFLGRCLTTGTAIDLLLDNSSTVRGIFDLWWSYRVLRQRLTCSFVNRNEWSRWIRIFNPTSSCSIFCSTSLYKEMSSTFGCNKHARLEFDQYQGMLSRWVECYTEVYAMYMYRWYIRICAWNLDMDVERVLPMFFAEDRRLDTVTQHMNTRKHPPWNGGSRNFASSAYSFPTCWRLTLFLHVDWSPCFRSMSIQCRISGW